MSDKKTQEITEVKGSTKRYAYKWLTYDGATKTDHGVTYYELPRPGQKYGEWMIHPEPATPDGNVCGFGRYHLMKRPDKRYAAERSWLWIAEYDASDIIGESNEKVSVKRLRLRRVSDDQFYKLIRRGYCRSANLSSADLRSADLRYANLSYADLRYANLRSADLRYANLRYANLSSADLRSADLRYANLSSADLRSADLRSADLRYANLSSANLSSADLRSADLSSADLRSADLRYANLRYANLSSADLRSANLSYADLRSADLRYANLLNDARYNTHTQFKDGFDPVAAGMVKVD